MVPSCNSTALTSKLVLGELSTSSRQNLALVMDGEPAARLLAEGEGSGLLGHQQPSCAGVALAILVAVLFGCCHGCQASWIVSDSGPVASTHGDVALVSVVSGIAHPLAVEGNSPFGLSDADPWSCRAIRRAQRQSTS